MPDDRKLLAEWFWTDRWMGSSAFLLPIGPRGLYREMLTQAWRRGARLPNDHEAIRRAVGCTIQEWNRYWPRVAQYWRVDGDALVNDTQAAVYRDAAEVQLRASLRGTNGANARWHKDSPSNAQALPEQWPPSLSPDVSKEHQPARYDERRPHPLDEFSAETNARDRFLAAYPVQQGQAAAKRAWAKLNPNADTVAAIFANLEARERLGWGKNARYLPYPGRFLDDRMWEETYIPRDADPPPAAAGARTVPDATSTADYLAQLRAGRG